MNARVPVLDDIDHRIVLATQAGLPLTPRPYHVLAGVLKIPAQEVMARLERMRDAGIIRRIALVPNHYALGFRANGMAVWDVDDGRIDALAARIAELPFVSHCYRRARRPPRWTCNLFVMVHGLTRAEVQSHAAAISEMLGDAARAHEILFSTRILKKTGMRLSRKDA